MSARTTAGSGKRDGPHPFRCAQYPTRQWHPERQPSSLYQRPQLRQATRARILMTRTEWPWDRASGTIDLANGRYGEVRMASPVSFTQKRAVVIRAKVMESKRIYRDIEISSDSTLEDLALAIVEAFGWDCDHCYGFYSPLGQSLHDSKEAYELFADLAEEDGSAMEVRDGVLGVKDTAVGDVFENRGKKMQFLFDYEDAVPVRLWRRS